MVVDEAIRFFLFLFFINLRYFGLCRINFQERWALSQPTPLRKSWYNLHIIFSKNFKPEILGMSTLFLSLEPPWGVGGLSFQRIVVGICYERWGQCECTMASGSYLTEVVNYLVWIVALMPTHYP